MLIKFEFAVRDICWLGVSLCDFFLRFILTYCLFCAVHKIDLMKISLYFSRSWKSGALKIKMQHFKLFIFGSINASVFGVRFFVRLSNINQFTEYNPCLNNNRDQNREGEILNHTFDRASIHKFWFVHM